jgi:hypothetical protein
MSAVLVRAAALSAALQPNIIQNTAASRRIQPQPARHCRLVDAIGWNAMSQ